MMEVFLVQLMAAGLGGISTALADRAYRGARIDHRAHSLWVAGSITVICLPVLVWTCNVFLGSGIVGHAVAGLIIIALFARVYRTLQKQLSAPASFGRYPLAASPADASRSRAARRGRLIS